MGCGDDCPLVQAAAAGGVADPRPQGMPPEQFRRVRDLIEAKVKDLLASL